MSEITVFEGMTEKRLREILNDIKNVRAAVYGDLCIDVYWYADMRMSELSRETPHFAMPIIDERVSLGGGGNVAANMAALKPKKVTASGTAGNDWRESELTRLMNAAGISSELIVRRPDLLTNAFCKPMRRGISDTIYEDPRLDFANVVPFGTDVEDALIAALDKVAEQTDVLCISDQLPLNVYGAVTARVREHIIKLAQNGLTVITDSRDKIGLYRDLILKPNEVEGARAAGLENAKDINDFAEAARTLAQNQNNEVIMTIGAKGSLYTTGEEVIHIPARIVDGEIDIVGAGDTFISGFALAVAAGASRPEAAFVAGLCSEVTIQKTGTTGTASPDEVIARFNG